MCPARARSLLVSCGFPGQGDELIDCGTSVAAAMPRQQGVPTRRARACAQIRSSITALFPNRDCFALVRPMSDERALQRLESVPAAQLRPEFREARRAPCTLKPKTLKTASATAPGVCPGSAAAPRLPQGAPRSHLRMRAHCLVDSLLPSGRLLF